MQNFGVVVQEIQVGHLPLQIGIINKELYRLIDQVSIGSSKILGSRTILWKGGSCKGNSAGTQDTIKPNTKATNSSL
jgi:hypothetical protein